MSSENSLQDTACDSLDEDHWMGQGAEQYLVLQADAMCMKYTIGAYEAQRYCLGSVVRANADSLALAALAVDVTVNSMTLWYFASSSHSVSDSDHDRDM